MGQGAEHQGPENLLVRAGQAGSRRGPETSKQIPRSGAEKTRRLLLRTADPNSTGTQADSEDHHIHLVLPTAASDVGRARFHSVSLCRSIL